MLVISRICWDHVYIYNLVVSCVVMIFYILIKGVCRPMKSGKDAKRTKLNAALQRLMITIMFL